MVITFRPEFEPPWTGQAQVTALTLSRLGQRDTATLVESLAGGKTLPAEILDRIVERTDGIPLFIEELTKTLLEGGLLREEDGRYVLAGPLPSLAIPSSLQDSLMARLDRLAPVERGGANRRSNRPRIFLRAAGGGRAPAGEPAPGRARPARRRGSDLPPRRPAASVFRLQARPRPGCCLRHLAAPPTPGAPCGHCDRSLEQRSAGHWASRHREQSVRAARVSLAQAEDWEKALSYTLEAAEQAAEALCPSRGDQPLLAGPGFVGAAAGQCRAEPGPCRRRPVADFAAGLDAGRGRAKHVCCGTSIERLKMQASDGNAAAAARLQAVKGYYLG